MATTTPNYGWDVPTSTDYVKDGATAIETLGDDIDSTLYTINGGTSAVGMQKIGSYAFTSSTSVSVDSVFNATYTNYAVKVYFTSVTTGDQVTTLTLRNSGGDIAGSSWSSGLYYASWGAGTSGLLYTNVSSSAYLPLISGDSGVASFDVYRPNLATKTTFTGTGTGANTSQQSGGRWNATDVATGFKINFGSSGNCTGVVKVYGYRD